MLYYKKKVNEVIGFVFSSIWQMKNTIILSFVALPSKEKNKKKTNTNIFFNK